MSEHWQQEDPVAHAGAKVASYVSVTAAAAQSIAQLRARQAQERAATDDRAARQARAEHTAAYSQARLGWSPILDDKARARTTVVDAGSAWARAQGWRPDPEAELASTLAEDRLRQLRPDVMDRYDRLRADGLEPVEAMTRVAPLFDRPAAHPGQPAPDRAALDAESAGYRAADAELTLYRNSSAIPDNPGTRRVDEHADAVGAAGPHLYRATAADSAARAAGAQAGVRTPVIIAGEDQPTPITTAVATRRTPTGSTPANTVPVVVRARPPGRATRR